MNIEYRIANFKWKGSSFDATATVLLSKQNVSKKFVAALLRMMIIFSLSIINSQLSIASEPIPAKKQDHPIALIGGTIHPVSSAAIDNGMILFENGKITKIGTKIELPPKTERIDISGRHVYPGLINTASQVGLQEIEAVRATLDVRETGRINPNVRTDVAVNPESELIPTTRANGITTVHLIPDGDLIAGSTSVIMLDGWTNEEMTLRTPAGVYVNWPTMTVMRSPFLPQSEEEQKKKIEKSINELRAAFDDARAYVKAKKAEPQKQKTDLRWEAMVPLFDRTIPLIVDANEVKQIQAAVQFAKDENVRLIIHGGRDAWRVAELLKENSVSVIVGPIHDLPNRRWEDFDNPFALPMKLHQAGILFSISGEGNAPMNERNMAYQAATAAAYGLPKEEALKSITLNAAKQLGIDAMVGSLDIGKDATLIVTTDDPLEIMSNVEMEFIQGKKIDLRSRHTQLWKKYEEKYRQLGIVK
jgi:imidazolonepropionase-like amidohydrolase